MGVLFRRRDRRSQRGFTYLWVIVAIALIGIGLLAVSEVWVTTARRQKLAELDWIGTQFTQAIGSYYYSASNINNRYPSSLQDLLEDRRDATMRRHLREVYLDPFTGVPDWEFVTSSDGRIHGVRANIPDGSGRAVKEFVFQP